MIKKNKKLHITLICITLMCIIAGGFIYRSKNSTRNTIIEELFNTNKDFGVYDSELLKSYNAKNMEKLDEGKELCAEDYFLIAYEYCTIKKDREEGMKYAIPAQNKRNIFTNRFTEIYNNYLIDCYYTYVKNDKVVLENIDKNIDNATAEDWNKHSNLITSDLFLCINFEDGIDFLLDRIEKILEKEDDLNTEASLKLIDTLALMNYNRGLYSKALERCMEIETILKRNDGSLSSSLENYHKARNMYIMGSIYNALGNFNLAKEILEDGLNIDIENQDMDNQTKVAIYHNLINIYVEEKDSEELGEIVLQYEKFFKENSNARDEITYYIMSVKYYIEKYELYGLEDDLNKAKYFMKLIDEYYDGNKTSLHNFRGQYNLYDNYLKYLDGDVYGALEKYKESLEASTENIEKRNILQNMIRIYKKEENYEEACKYTEQLSELKEAESLLINEDYTSYSIEKYENELEVKRLNKEKLHNYIKIFILILVSTVSIVVMFMRNKRLRENNITDGLTKVYNRVRFNEIYEKKLKVKEEFYLYIFDIDNFKKVNDTYGHMTGDEVLKKVAKATKDAVGNKGSIYRYGGEEFVVLTDYRDEVSVIKMAEDIRKNVEALKWDNGMNITISLGIANSREERENVLEVADKHLYVSKTTGKNKVTLAS